MNDVVKTARAILDGKQAAPEDLKTLVEALQGKLEFGLARKLLAMASVQQPQNVWMAQQLALCTYKDEELLPDHRYADALRILEAIGLRDPNNNNAETLDLGGAVYKRRWEAQGQLEHLYEALDFYRAAYERNPADDQGYGGSNAAFILDLLAARARIVAKRSGTQPHEAETLATQARALREDILTRLSQLADKEPELAGQYGFIVTLAAIHFGLGNYPEAGQWLGRTAELTVREWQQQTTFRQLVMLARLQGIKPPAENTDPAAWEPAWQALTPLLGKDSKDTELALSCHRGKVGLALSGGGFRASFFHLGVLARLAEMDVLRGVEVLSTVSGGSIVGAHYYLELQNLLQTRQDRDITREDYIAVVRRVQENFFQGVQCNLRVRVLANFGKNLRMILFPKKYTRSHRLGELYERELYARVQDGHEAGKPRRMKDLLINPQGQAAPFKPKFSNWRRRAKVPVLLLNTTNLNSSHNWHFTASWMGEPPGLVGSEVDTNERYRRLYYDQAPTQQLQEYQLGHAVAASACVPTLFEPLVIDRLYPERVVRLVDGGVHDNQGVAGLLDEGCTLILCSDATGQLHDLPNPSDLALQVGLRSKDILMNRVREAQYQDLLGRLDSRALGGLFFIHLKKGLTVHPLDWINCDDPTPEPKQKQPTTTRYGVDKDVQEQLAAVRTDLDAFTEVEAYALMLSGYLMTEYEFQELQKQHEKNGEPGTWGGFDCSAQREDWPFLPLEPIIQQPPHSSQQRADLGLQLQVSTALFFKAWQLNPVLRVVKWPLLVAVAVGVLVLVCQYQQTPLLTVGELFWGLLILVLLEFAPSYFTAILQWLRRLYERLFRGQLQPTLATETQRFKGLVSRLGLALGGYVFAKIHLHVFNSLYLKRGRLKRLLQLR